MYSISQEMPIVYQIKYAKFVKTRRVKNIFFGSIIGGVYVWSLIEITIHSANILFWGWLICFGLSMEVLIRKI